MTPSGVEQKYMVEAAFCRGRMIETMTPSGVEQCFLVETYFGPTT